MNLRRPFPNDPRATTDATAASFSALTGVLRTPHTRRQTIAAFAGGLLALGSARRGAAQNPAPVSGYRVVAKYPHDRAAYTQGLVYRDGVLYEGTGLLGRSTLRRVELDSGDVLQNHALDRRYFGEGIAVVDNRIYQLTWKNKTCLVYDRESFEPLTTYFYETEGWGLTTDGSRLIMSDGSNRLVFRDAKTFAETGHVDVFVGEQPLQLLNELEMVDGEVWANVYRTDFIARIDPVSGQVQSWIDLTGLLSERERGKRPVDVLNGIAHDPANGRLFVTGKLWPKLFEIELVPPG